MRITNVSLCIQRTNFHLFIIILLIMVSGIVTISSGDSRGARMTSTENKRNIVESLNTNYAEVDEDIADLISKLRLPTRLGGLGISYGELTNEELRDFLSKKENVVKVKTILAQLNSEVGKKIEKILNNETTDKSFDKNAGKETFEYLMESGISEICQHIAQVAHLDYYVYTFQALSVISTVAGGVEAYFGFMESFTTHQERITVFRSYFENIRPNSDSPREAFNELEIDYPGVLDKMIVEQKPLLKKLQGVTEEDKVEYSNYLEFAYQSWKLTTDSTFRQNVKDDLIKSVEDF